MKVRTVQTQPAARPRRNTMHTQAYTAPKN